MDKSEKKNVKVEFKNLLREIKNDLNREIYNLLKGKETHTAKILIFAKLIYRLTTQA